ncbi:MAG: aquaporin Z [Candidatus Endonucleobacter sp. (ex Gigantidas childressi)]|nr:aquaporin Z [Candidatus Endonucleobacter sp. (ex Gigantidas childressi)]
MTLTKKLSAEFIGTLWLVLGGCGSAVLAVTLPDVNIGLLGVSFAFGLTLLTMSFAIGHISGCHLNPAVSIGLWVGGRFPATELAPYICAQVTGGLAGASILYVIATGQAGFDVAAGFATNGYAEHSPGGYSLTAALVTEVVMAFMFLMIILGATDKRAPKGFAPLAIGLTLTLIHLISIPVTNTSVNPARSTGVAIFEGGLALSQLWLFWLAPIVGAILGGAVYRWLEAEQGNNLSRVIGKMIVSKKQKELSAKRPSATQHGSAVIASKATKSYKSYKPYNTSKNTKKSAKQH